MSPEPEELDRRLGRIRETLRALELHAEQTILSGACDTDGTGARIAVFAEGGVHVWQVTEPECSNEDLEKTVDVLIEHLKSFRASLHHHAMACPSEQRKH